MAAIGDALAVHDKIKFVAARLTVGRAYRSIAAEGIRIPSFRLIASAFRASAFALLVIFISSSRVDDRPLVRRSETGARTGVTRPAPP